MDSHPMQESNISKEKPFSLASWIKRGLKKGKNFLDRIEIKVAIRGGIAAALSWFLGVWFSKAMAHPDTLVSGTWCVLSAFVVLQSHLGGTYKAAWERFLGVFIGSLIGGVCTSFFGAHPLTLGGSVILTVCLLSFLNLKDSIRIACMSLSVVMILWGLSPEISPWTFAFFRFMDSALGILIAVVIAHTLWPSEATQMLRQKMSQLLNLSGKLYRMLLSMDGELEEFNLAYRKTLDEGDNLIVESRKFLSESKLELLIKASSTDQWENLIDDAERLFHKVLEMHAFRKFQLRRILDSELTSYLTQTANLTEVVFHELSRALLTGEKAESLPQLQMTVHELSVDLERFRTTRATRQFNFADVENYFVFFSNLKQVIDELLVLEEKINQLNRVS
jgi:uncharacterized membrane protein YccC